MKVMVILIVTGALGTTPKRLVRGREELEIGGRPEYSKESWRLLETCYELNPS